MSFLLFFNGRDLSLSIEGWNLHLTNRKFLAFQQVIKLNPDKVFPIFILCSQKGKNRYSGNSLKNEFYQVLNSQL
ncbi:hypothetical protein ED312_13550 [Sinomicrobium pectinilyticum]|uniref:Uncharacterized protein n=1 Tax=Sinomicrobium pectinilyticum TaxID=1084421 RepID=A0A3N0EA36_SINP1|nr:hypothetical protein ED312_13550 [Sinomicrobium pectinilyticum]